MKNQYPENIVQAIVLLFIGFIAVVPIIAFKEALNLNISGDIYNNFLFLVLFLVVSFVYFKKNKQQVSFNQFWNTPVRIPAKTWFLLLCLLLLFQLGINVPISKYLTYHMGQSHNISNPLENIGIGIGAILLAPICEEIIFRGIILRGFLGNYPTVPAIIYAALIFSIIHLYPTLLLGAFVLGLILGYIFYLTKNILPGIIFHTLANFINLGMGYLLFLFYGKSSVADVYGTATVWVLIVSSILCLSISFLIVQGQKKNKTYMR